MSPQINSEFHKRRFCCFSFSHHKDCSSDINKQRYWVWRKPVIAYGMSQRMQVMQLTIQKSKQVTVATGGKRVSHVTIMWSWLPNFEPTVNSFKLTKTIPNWPSWRFPRIPPVTRFPALGSCQRSQVFPRLALGIFPRLLRATSFPGLASRFAFCFGFVRCAFYRCSDPLTSSA